MKKIAVLGSNTGEIFEAIVNYFKNSSTEVVCFSDNLKSEILITAKKLSVEAKYLPYDESSEYFNTHNFDLIVLSDYDRELSPELIDSGRFINIHPSLLPAFKGKDAISRAFNSGVKVSGVTVHMITNDIDGGKILAQYPVLIGNLTHFDEFRQEIYDLEKVIYPIVIDKFLKDEVFDFSDLINGKSNSSKCNCCSCN